MSSPYNMPSYYETKNKHGRYSHTRWNSIQLLRSTLLHTLQENGCKTYKRLTLKCPNQQKVLGTMDFCQFTVVQIFLSIFLSNFVNVFVNFVNFLIFCQFLWIFLKGQSLRIRQPLHFTFPSFTFNLFPSPKHVSHIY